MIETENGIRITDNDDILSSVIASLSRNNTFCPNIKKCYLEKDVKRRILDRDTKKMTKVLRDVLRVSFTDGTWVEVVRNPTDNDDMSTAVLYAIIKRLYGKPTSGGYVNGCGFMNKIKDVVKNIVTPQKEEEEKRRKMEAKKESDNKSHTEAMIRKEKNPSLGIRMRNLEDKFEKLIEKLSK